MRSLLLALLAASGCGEVAKLQTDAKVAMCGDSVVDPGEDCDTGAMSASCNDDCTIARCGDMKVNDAAGEECEPGGENNTSSCTALCKATAAFPSTGAEGAFAPAADTVLPAGVHHFTTISIPAGVTVTTDGPGVLDLRATGAVTIDGRVDVSGGNGGDGGMAQGCYNGGGQGGGTGNPTAGVNGMTGCVATSVGGMGAVGLNGAIFSGSCPAQGGGFGGGMGGGTCNGGGGGGGYAGGGGGGGYNGGNGANGASAASGVGGIGALSNVNVDGAGKVSGTGGAGLGRYRGQNGLFFPGCVASGYPGSSGGGGAIGALAQSDLAVATTFQPGSGGGGGAAHCSVCGQGAGGGGGGGGAIRIASAVSITVGATGAILANGGAGGSGFVANTGNGGGGGGSGGVVYLAAPTLDVQAGATVSAIGGPGGNSQPTNCGRGGEGGYGRIRISATQANCKLDGAFTPPLNAAACAPANVPEKVYVAPYPN